MKTRIYAAPAVKGLMVMGVCGRANKAADTAILVLYDSLVRVTNVGSHSSEFGSV